MRRASQTVSQHYTVQGRPILPGIAPHSSLAHFRVIVEHQLRLRFASKNTMQEEWTPSDVCDTLIEAVERFNLSTRMAGTIREYRDKNDERVVAFCHEVGKGRTLRGQWFYATNDAAMNYVWFHSVRELVQRGAEADNVNVIDLGLNGTEGMNDAHAKLKARYGFELVDDWPAVVDYRGCFW